MTPTAPRFYSAAVSDQGPVRSNNEDRVWADDARGIYVVVDGMGGHEAGEHAAEIAVERIRARLERATGGAEQRVREAITLANNAVYEAAQSNPDWNGMACVLTVAVVENGRATVGHVGDSRLYKLRRGSIQKITHDHSPVGEREDKGELTEEEAMRHPRRNEVFRDVGTQPRTPDDDDFIETAAVEVEPDSALLLCSDGLSDVLTSGEILAIVERHGGDPDEAARALIEEASNNGKDNISVVLAAGERFARRTGARSDAEVTARLRPTRGLGDLWLWAAGGLLLGVVLGGFGFAAWQARKAPEPIVPLRVEPPDGIKAALDKARPGETVLVAPGTYTGPLYLKDGVDLVASPAYEAVIEGPVIADGVRTGRFEGFKVRGAGVGITVRGGSALLLSRLEITGNRVGLEITAGSKPNVAACAIHNNGGPGVIVAGGAQPFLEHNVIANNGTQAGALAPGLLIRSRTPIRAAANTFANNGAEAIWSAAPDDSLERTNFFAGAGREPARGKAPVRVKFIAPEAGAAR